MSFLVIDLLANFFYSIFGSGIIMVLVIVGVFMLAVLAMRGDLSVMLILLIPLLAGFVLNSAGSNFLELPAWILLSVFIVAGFLFATVFFILTR